MFDRPIVLNPYPPSNPVSTEVLILYTAFIVFVYVLGLVMGFLIGRERYKPKVIVEEVDYSDFIVGSDENSDSVYEEEATSCEIE